MTEVLKREARIFFPETFKVGEWDDLEPFFKRLLDAEIDNVESLRKWFQNRSELEALISEDMGWRYINMTRFTDNEEHNRRYMDFVQNIQPKMSPFSDKLNKKAVASEYLSKLETEPGYDIMIRGMKRAIEIFRKESIPLETELQTLAQEYGQVSGAMSVFIDDQELTLQQAGVKLQSIDRAERQRVYKKISERRLEDKDKLNKIL